MTILKNVAIALVVVKPGSKNQQTLLVVDEKVKTY